MSTTASGPPEQSLTNTLVLALSQCQDQVRQLAEQKRTIDDLSLENQRLKHDLDQLRNKPGDDIEAKYALQFQEAFKQVAGKQVEVDRLKAKLRSLKDKARQHGLTEFISSPLANSVHDPETRSYQASTPLHTSLQHQDDAKIKIEHDETSHTPVMNLVPSRKRPRSLSPVREPLREVSGNPIIKRNDLGRTENLKSGSISVADKAIAAIPDIAEDGDQHIHRKRKSEVEPKTKVIPTSVYNRLGQLLDVPAPTGPSLLSARNNSPISKMTNVLEANPAGYPLPSSDSSTPQTITQAKAPSPPSGEFSRSSNHKQRDKGKLRDKPINQLGLTHFKINPTVNAGLDYAYNHVVRGEERQCFPGCRRECCAGTFRAIAKSLPNFSGKNGQRMSDDELLLDFLGAGSEDRIKNLTRTARDNLIHEARTKVVADAYGRMHRDVHERGKSPPGFWRTDMPGSQEQREDREIAKAVEREEISRRYNEAMKGGGRWIFADE